MSQIGCFIPAQAASIRICDRILTRLGSSDHLESNSSSFFKEMAEISFILQNITDKSLIIIDELGRSTSNRDGISLSWAISEKILLTKAQTLFVTHYKELTELQKIYPNVKNYFMNVHSQNQNVKFMFQVSEGSK